MKTKKINVLVEGRLSEDEMNYLLAGNGIPACSIDNGVITNPCPKNTSTCPSKIITPCNPIYNLPSLCTVDDPSYNSI